MKRSIIVEESLISEIQAEIDVLIEQWKEEGATDVVVLTHPRGIHNNPQELKDKLIQIDNLEGALLIGELPIAMLYKENMNYNHPFMSDYFFTDLTGEWTIDDRNVATAISPNNPAIFVGRVIFAQETGWVYSSNNLEDLTEIDFYKRYLLKLINFRKFSRYLIVEGVPFPNFIPPPNSVNMRFPPTIRHGFRGLFIFHLNDPGADYSPYLDIFRHLYPLENIKHQDGVTKDEMYTMVTTESYDSIWVLAHSSAGGHNMASLTRWNNSDYYNSDIRINFYFFEACGVGGITWYEQEHPDDPSVLKLTEDNLVSNIQFAHNGGIIILAQSISATFLNAEYYFDQLQAELSFGAALKNWFGENYDVENDNYHCYMNLFGDPFVKFVLLEDRTACIIRTSYYGHSKEYKLTTMRKYRDTILKKTKSGEKKINFYYKFSKRFVKFSTKSKIFRAIVRGTTGLALRIVSIRLNRISKKNLKK